MMNQRQSLATALFATFLVAVFGGRLLAVGPHDQLLPDSTKLFVYTPDAKRMQAHWHATQFWKVYDDENMRAFRTEYSRFLESGESSLDKLTGFTYDELREITTGAVSAAMVPTDDRQFAYVLLADVTESAERANALLAGAAARLQQAGAKATTETLHGTEVAVFTVTTEDDTAEQVTHFLRDNLLCIATDLSVAEGILSRWDSASEGTLAAVPAYQECNKTCTAEANVGEPDIHWFADPIGYLKIANPPDPDGLEQNNSTELLVKHGGEALTGIGGTIGFDAEKHDVVMRFLVHAPQPHRGAMKLFSPLTATNVAPQDWLPSNANMYTTIYWDLMKVIDNIGPLFDDMVGDGIEGTFDDLLGDLASDEGPRVDLRKDLIELIGPRITVINDAITPIGEGSERSLIAVETKDETKVALSLKKLLRDDPGVRRLRITGFDNDLWQIGEDSDLFADRDDGPRLTSSAAMVAHGHLILATHTDLLRDLLRRAPDPEKLGDAADLKALDAQLQRFIPKGGVGRIYSRTHRDFETTYELLRQDKADELQSMYGMIVSRLLKQARDEETGELRIDFSTLAPFDQIRKHLGMIGVNGKNHDSGWYVVIIATPPN